MVRRDDASDDDQFGAAPPPAQGASGGGADGRGGPRDGRQDGPNGDLHDDLFAPDDEHDAASGEHVEHVDEGEHDFVDGHEGGEHFADHHYADENDADPHYADQNYADHGYDDEHDHGVIGATVLDAGHRRRRGRTRALAVTAAGLVLLVGVVVAVLGLSPIVGSLTASKDFEGPGSGSVVYTVHDGDSRQEIADGLEKAGVVKTAGAFLDAFTDRPGAEVQPGQYTLKKEMKAADALAYLRGEGRDVVKVTLREGLWKSEVYAALSKATKVPLAEYTKAEVTARTQPDTLGLPSSAKGNVEGYLFPATYEFTPGTSATDQLRMLVSKSTSQLRELGVDDTQMERIVIIASIVEAEARLDADRPKVARVIENRLAKKMPLQLDSTVSYGVQKRAITTTDAERAAKNGYNTYVRPGLPAGPISNPGAASIKAAQAPAAGPWLYFVTVNPVTGETRFATTGAQHQANVALFQKWCQANPGKC